MHKHPLAACVLLPNLGGKPVQKLREKMVFGFTLPTTSTRGIVTVVCKDTFIPQFCRNIPSSLSTAARSVFSDETSYLYPLSTGPTIRTDKLILYIVERSR